MPSQRAFLVLEVSREACALPLEGVQEIIPMAWLSRSPSSPPILEGLLNLRGRSIPVVALSRLFRLPEEPLRLYTPLVVLRDGNHPIALVVDAINQIVSVTEEAFVPAPEGHSFNDCSKEGVVVQGRIIPVVSSERLLLKEEWHRLSEFQAIEQQRLRDVEESKA